MAGSQGWVRNSALDQTDGTSGSPVYQNYDYVGAGGENYAAHLLVSGIDLVHT